MGRTLGSASIPFFACACLLTVIVLHVTAFASPHWASNGESDFGLWRYDKCIPTRVIAVRDSACRKIERSWDIDDWFHAMRALECIAVIFWAFPLVIIPVYMYVALGLYYRCMMGTMTVFTLIGTVCNIVGVIVFGVKIEANDSWDWRWCIIVAACAGILGIVTFIIFLVAFCFRPVFSSKTHLLSGFYVEPDRNRMYVIENVDYLKPGPLDASHVNPALEE